MSVKIGRKIFYEIATGNIIVDTGERQGAVIATTAEQDIASYRALSERNRSTFDVIELPFGANAQDFAECNGYRVNVETKALEFSHPDPNQPEGEPVYQKPLSVELQEIKNSKKTANEKYAELDIETATIEQIKEAKLAALDELCNMNILSGITHEIDGVVYLFSTSLPAQANLTGAKVRFMAGEITEVEWTVVNTETAKIERIILDEPLFKIISEKVFAHIDANVKKLRNILGPQVELATTVEEVDQINW